MVPLSREFFVDTVDALPDEKFTSIDYNFQLFKFRSLPMCYAVATPELWRACIGVDTLSGLHKRLLEWKHVALRYEAKHGGINWAFDQIMLTKYFSQCPAANYANFGGHRLERKDIGAQPVSSLERKIAQGFYRDYHIFANQPSSLTQAHLSSLVLDILHRSGRR